MVAEYRLSLVGLIETKVSFGRRHQLARDLLPGWEVFYNYNNQCNGRIWAAWDPTVHTVQVLFSSKQLLHLLVQILDTQQQFLVSLVYGMNSSQERLPLWEAICSLYQSSQCLPWVLLGDFNIVRSVSEKEGGDLSWTSAMEDLNTCCSNAELDDLRFIGH